uniref:pentapeptide repeat-containing protein n=1 Tax=Streptomyces sp. HSW2009 TaxID=3142890 RepID=UPI0032ED02E9
MVARPRRVRTHAVRAQPYELTPSSDPRAPGRANLTRANLTRANPTRANLTRTNSMRTNSLRTDPCPEVRPPRAVRSGLSAPGGTVRPPRWSRGSSRSRPVLPPRSAWRGRGGRGPR